MHRKLKWVAKLGMLAVGIALVEWAHRSMSPKWKEHLAGGLAAFLFVAIWELMKHEIADAQEKAKRAEAAAEALSGLCRVGEYDLPLPEDSRWTRETSGSTSRPGQTLHLLSIGTAISVADDGGVFIDRLATPATSTNRTYAKRVWRAYRQRAVDKLSGAQ